MSNLVEIDVAAAEEAAKSGVVRFVQVYVSGILAAWIGIDGQVNVSGLVGAVEHHSDAAAGVAILAALQAAGLGYLIGQSAKRGLKKLSARL